MSATEASRQREQSRKSASTKRMNPMSDRFDIKAFHHIEFYCGDASNVARRFMWGLGLEMVAKSDQSTGNKCHASYVVQSSELRLMFTAPYSSAGVATMGSTTALPGFDPAFAHEFFRKHGLAGRAIGIEVADAADAYAQCVSRGGEGVCPPVRMTDKFGAGDATIAEVRAYGEVVLRFISFSDSSSGSGDGSGGGDNGGGNDAAYTGTFLPNFAAVMPPPGKGPAAAQSGLRRLDHAVGNVWDLAERVRAMAAMTGMHEFAEFTAEDVGTVDSGLNSVVLASNNEEVLLPLNEPTYGTPRKSQIQTFLEQNDGPGLQHLALKSDDIFKTMRLMRERSFLGGFEFMDCPSAEYYAALPKRIPSLTAAQLAQIEELGLLADEDDQGILLQVFTKPVGDRATFFLEIIQRIGCNYEAPDGTLRQRGGCGGFGKGNFRELFKSIEEYERTLEAAAAGGASSAAAAAD
ncbi:unnamed protein product [Phaeothamnion confervicola]